ncbi:MAG TPA: serine/threonine-protein kinase [Vicinamibacterales bacterium]|nr:serine/threonine-protein kinase [Vicinamibacterales bacterium]
MSASPAVRCANCGTPAPDGQRFCGACGAGLPASSETETALLPPPASAPNAPIATRAGFLPGVVLAGRYRIAGLLGRGGMGEVYRADDLKLGQPVALKFLPADVETDSDRLERFLTEVRVSLRVTHPNVCRVFDIGVLEAPAGQGGPRHFLSMEYVDGEDLASLLRRIGRLPEDKAIEIARQLCAGLTAAHDEGVLHRDLKPANIMIDGRGRAKIADFGLATASGVSGAEARVGTPQYMAPEQVAGGELTERTDLYALGLVLYELFTGKRAFEVRNLDDLQRLRSSTPTSPTSHVSGLNVLVERAILRCLEIDPVNRPASATALAAALPGGDPLAMMIAAGDTPSPEMVAAAGSGTRMRPTVAWSVVAVMIVTAIVGALFAQRTLLYRVGVPQKSPEVMREVARELLASLGFPAAADREWGLEPNYQFLVAMAAGQVPNAPVRLREHGLSFWYRESPVAMEKWALLGPDGIARRGFIDPPMRYSNQTRLRFDSAGRLTLLEAIPLQLPEAAPVGAVEWRTLFRAGGLDGSDWTPTEPKWTPAFHSDARFAWVRAGAAGDGMPTRVEAASFLGRPTAFAVLFPWSAPERQLQSRRSRQEQIGNLITVLILTAVMIGSAIVARRNYMRERADMRGALRVGATVAILGFLSWLGDDTHQPSIWELYLFIVNAGFVLLFGIFVAVFYLSLEPYVRRTWPHMIVSWSRLVAGNWRDPLVARDVLIGLGAAGITHLLNGAGFSLATHLSGIPPRVTNEWRPLLGGTHVITAIMINLAWAVFLSLLFLFVLFTIRRLLRNEWAAIFTSALLLSANVTLESGSLFALAPFLALNLLTFIVLSRVGLVATIAITFGLTILEAFPLTIPPSGWTAGVGLIGILFLTALAIVCVRIATGEDHRRRAA